MWALVLLLLILSYFRQVSPTVTVTYRTMPLDITDLANAHDPETQQSSSNHPYVPVEETPAAR